MSKSGRAAGFPVAHTRGYAGRGPDTGDDRGAYCVECSMAVEEYVWPCAAAGASYRWPPTSALRFDLARVVAERDRARGIAVELEQENARLTAELDACRTWQAKRVVAISQDPMCVKWMRESEQLAEENDALRAAVAAVRALCDDVIAVEDHGQSRAIPPTRRRLALAIAAALAVPADTPAEATE